MGLTIEELNFFVQNNEAMQPLYVHHYDGEKAFGLYSRDNRPYVRVLDYINHGGLDISGFSTLRIGESPGGGEVRAPCTMKIVRAGNDISFGNFLVGQLPASMGPLLADKYLIMAHFASISAKVTKHLASGEMLPKGTVVGIEGMTGENCTGHHVHIGIVKEMVGKKWNQIDYKYLIPLLLNIPIPPEDKLYRESPTKSKPGHYYWYLHPDRYSANPESSLEDLIYTQGHQLAATTPGGAPTYSVAVGQYTVYGKIIVSGITWVRIRKNSLDLWLPLGNGVGFTNPVTPGGWLPLGRYPGIYFTEAKQRAETAKTASEAATTKADAEDVKAAAARAQIAAAQAQQAAAENALRALEPKADSLILRMAAKLTEAGAFAKAQVQNLVLLISIWYSNIYAGTLQKLGDVRVWFALWFETFLARMDYVRDPVTGKLRKLEDMVESLYSTHRLGALTAREYHELALAANGYDGHALTAGQYDVEASARLI